MVLVVFKGAVATIRNSTYGDLSSEEGDSLDSVVRDPWGTTTGFLCSDSQGGTQVKASARRLKPKEREAFMSAVERLLDKKLAPRRFYSMLVRLILVIAH